MTARSITVEEKGLKDVKFSNCLMNKLTAYLLQIGQFNYVYLHLGYVILYFSVTTIAIMDIT